MSLWRLRVAAVTAAVVVVTWLAAAQTALVATSDEGPASRPRADRLGDSFRNGFTLQKEDRESSHRVVASCQLDLASVSVPSPADIGCLLSGGASELGNPGQKTRKVDGELSVALRLIFRF